VLSASWLTRRPPLALACALALALLAGTAGCGGSEEAGGSRDTGAGAGAGGDGDGDGDGDGRTLSIGAIPDQDPQELQRLYGRVAAYLSDALRVRVAYRPVTDYTASVTGFRVGDLDLVWFGGLTGVQARRQVPDARVLAQRDIDRDFHSVFIAGTDTGIRPVESAGGLRALAGRRFTFGSESSTSGRVMPQYFLDRAGVSPEDFEGRTGFSGSHDKTIALVASGTYDAGVLNEQVWRSRTADGTVDERKVRVVWRSPGYHDYHWMARPDLDERFGAGFGDKVRDALLALDADDPEQAEILELFGAKRFVPSSASDHAEIERAARVDGLLK
jgi:phosphonate transport system substrate-binding protein